MGYLTENMAGRLGITLTVNASYSTQHHMYVNSGEKKNRWGGWSQKLVCGRLFQSLHRSNCKHNTALFGMENLAHLKYVCYSVCVCVWEYRSVVFWNVPELVCLMLPQYWVSILPSRCSSTAVTLCSHWISWSGKWHQSLMSLVLPTLIPWVKWDLPGFFSVKLLFFLYD